MPKAARAQDRSLEALGITRVGRLTGLDRVRVEVASAVRPTGHVLQVSNGKGFTFEQARAGAISEAAELTASERVDPARLRWGSLRQLRAQGLTVWSPERLGSAGALVAPDLWSEDLRISWIAARTVGSRQEVWVPAQAVYCPPSGIALGPAVVGWTTNGLGAHATVDEALEHAVFEAIERDQLARSLPEGWTPERMRRAVIKPELLNELEPRLDVWVRDLWERGFRLHLFDLTPKGRAALGVPIAGAILVEVDGMIPVTSGYAAGPRMRDALWSAFHEAAQSRLTDIHGAREDILPPDLDRDAQLIAWTATLPLSKRGEAQPQPRFRDGRARGSLPKGAKKVSALSALRSRRIEAAWVDLSLPDTGRSVVKVIVPSFKQTELL